MNKVLIVDDHLVVREGLKLLIETNDQYTIIGEAENGKVAVRLADELEPDIILMDLYMPEMSGLEAIKQIKEKHDTPIIILTTYNEDHLMIEGIELGAKGYLLKIRVQKPFFTQWMQPSEEMCYCSLISLNVCKKSNLSG